MKKQADRTLQASCKECCVYQPGIKGVIKPWSQVKAERAKGKETWVVDEVREPSDPMLFVTLHAATIKAASIFETPRIKEAIRSGRIYGLPFAQKMADAAILGEEHKNNFYIRSPNGKTIAVCLTSPELDLARRNKKDIAAGEKIGEALFKDFPAEDIRHCSRPMHLGIRSNNKRQGGFTTNRENSRPVSDEGLRWAWDFYQRHIAVLLDLLPLDFQARLQMRQKPFEWFKKDVMGEGQCALIMPAFSVAAWLSGYTYVPLREQKDHESSMPSPSTSSLPTPAASSVCSLGPATSSSCAPTSSTWSTCLEPLEQRPTPALRRTARRREPVLAAGEGGQDKVGGVWPKTTTSHARSSETRSGLCCARARLPTWSSCASWQSQRMASVPSSCRSLPSDTRRAFGRP